MARRLPRRLEHIRSAEQVAQEHKAADKACGREWECACGACNTARRVEVTLAKLGAERLRVEG